MAPQGRNSIIHAEQLPVPIVGIGHSAGGLEPLSDLLAQLPDEPGLILIVVSHVGTREGVLPEVVGRMTGLEIVAVEGTGDIPLRRDHIYVARAGQRLSVRDETLHVEPHSDAHIRSTPSSAPSPRPVATPPLPWSYPAAAPTGPTGSG